jgi:hypothetical protein
MASSNATRNFGFRRFTNTVREGRLRAPASGTVLKLGTGVEVDAADTDRVRQATSATGTGGAGLVGQLVGALWYEVDSQNYNDPRFGAAAGQSPVDMDYAPNGRMVQVIHGPGTKVWFRNTEANTTEPGLNYPSTRDEVVMVANLGFNGTGDLAVDDLLGWDDTNDVWAETTIAFAVMRVTAVDNSANTCDAEFLV